MKEKTYTVQEFIGECLIKDIGRLKDEYPYFAFLLMAAGIEFLGKCLNEHVEWQTQGQSRPDFDTGISLFPPKYHGMDLYNNLRCGLAHAFIPDKGLRLSDVKGQDNTVLSCEEFYDDFKAACNKVMSGQVAMPVKKLSDPFMNVKDDGETVASGGTSPTQSISQ